MDLNKNIKLINELLKEVYNLKHQIDKFDGRFEGYTDWVRENKFKKGFSEPTLSKANTYFTKEVLPKLREDESFLKQYDFNNDSKAKKLNEYLVYMDEYVELINKRNLSGRKWFFYFLDIGENRRDYPRLGRAVLETKENKNAQLDVPEEHAKPYLGSFSKLNETIYFFDLKMGKNERRLHIKVFLRKASDALMIGSYSTFDERIYTGCFVLEQISKKHESFENPEAMFLSSKDNPEVYKQVDLSIKKYLSIKNKNYHAISRRQKSTAAELDNFTNNSPIPDKKSIEDRFLDFERPIAFIATPQTTVSGTPDEVVNKRNVLKRMIEDLKKYFKNKVDFESENSEIEAMKPLDCYNLLSSARYFIIILTRTKVPSFCLIQLSWAINLSKHILLITEEDALSNRFDSLNKMNPNFQKVEYVDIAKNRSDIYIKIKNFIKDNMLT